MLVAASGGKDSTACLHILSQKYSVEALAIDEGIEGYREHTLKDLENFCVKHGIRLHIVALKKVLGKTLDEFLKRNRMKPCTACGIARRYLLNRHARLLGADCIATGHNLDDEAQSVLMNLFRNQPNVSARLGPLTGIVSDSRFIPRVKPLYFLTEREVAAYSLLKGFGLDYNECPYAPESFRASVRDELNRYEETHPGTKKNIIRSFMKMLPGLKKKYATQDVLGECVTCGEPAMQKQCTFCQLKKKALLMPRKL